MAKFKVIISNPETGKSNIVELEGPKAVPLVGRKIGETLDGTVAGLSGQKIQITGGSDKDGVPMRASIHGGVRTAVILSEGVGFKSQQKGERKRKNIRGNMITEEIVQINMKIVKTLEKTEKKEKPTKLEKKEEKVETKKKEPEKPHGKTEKTQKRESVEKSGGKSTEKTAQTA
jgi:small subunit ribosomal protein S6e